MSEYDKSFQGGKDTIMDVYRDHQARQRECYCPICQMAQQVLKQREAECEDTRPA